MTLQEAADAYASARLEFERLNRATDEAFKVAYSAAQAARDSLEKRNEAQRQLLELAADAARS